MFCGDDSPVELVPDRFLLRVVFITTDSSCRLPRTPPKTSSSSFVAANWSTPNNYRKW